jgi:hypothetical protein
LCGARTNDAIFLRILEAPPGFEPGMEVLQTSALPLGDGADRVKTIDYRGIPTASRSGDNNKSSVCRKESSITVYASQTS